MYHSQNQNHARVNVENKQFRSMPHKIWPAQTRDLDELVLPDTSVAFSIQIADEIEMFEDAYFAIFVASKPWFWSTYVLTLLFKAHEFPASSLL